MSRDTSKHAASAGTQRLGARDVARIGFGAMHLARCAETPEHAVTVLKRAIELGVNHVDTAQFYGDGFVNRIICEALRESPNVVIATKIGGESNPGGEIPIRPAQRPEELRASVENNLRTLGVDHLDVVNLRRMDVGPGLKAEGDQVVDLDDQLSVMIALRDAGKIRAIGLSGVDLDGLKRAISADVACVQNAYSMISRQYEGMLDLCVDRQIAWVPFFPLGGAHFHEWPKVTDEPKVIQIAARLGVTSSQLGLAWLLAHKPNILLIPGTASIGHLEENIASASISLDSDVLAELDAEFGDAI